jgi:hypothetical protein
MTTCQENTASVRKSPTGIRFEIWAWRTGFPEGNSVAFEDARKAFLSLIVQSGGRIFGHSFRRLWHTGQWIGKRRSGGVKTKKQYHAPTISSDPAQFGVYGQYGGDETPVPQLQPFFNLCCS